MKDMYIGNQKALMKETEKTGINEDMSLYVNWKNYTKSSIEIPAVVAI